MAMKRANGTGTVYKRKEKKVRKPYRATVTLGYDGNGKAIRKHIGYFASQKEAYDAIALFLSDPTALQEKRIITLQQCYEWMMQDAERAGLSEGRIKNLTAQSKHFEDLMPMDVTVLRAAHAQYLFDKFTFAKSYQTQLKAFLVQVVNVAIKHEIVTRNYMSDIIISQKAKSMKVAKIFTEQDVHALWQRSDEDIVKVVLIYIYTGMRLNELMQMHPDNVHLKERYMIGGSKTDAGRDRAIPIADCIAPFIAEFYAQAKFSRADSIIPLEINQYSYRRHLERLCEELGIDRHKPHDTRHTFVSMCSNADVQEIIVKRIVGHSSKQNITQAVYTHKTVQQYIDAVNKLPWGDQLENGSNLGVTVPNFS